MVKPIVLDRSKREEDSGSTPDRTLSGSLEINSLRSELTEFRRLSLRLSRPLPLNFHPSSSGALGSSISLFTPFWLSLSMIHLKSLCWIVYCHVFIEWIHILRTARGKFKWLWFVPVDYFQLKKRSIKKSRLDVKNFK